MQIQFKKFKSPSNVLLNTYIYADLTLLENVISSDNPGGPLGYFRQGEGFQMRFVFLH